MKTLNGIVLGPDSPLKAGPRKCRSEKVEQAQCDDMVLRVGEGSSVVNLSQARASMVTRGLPDRRYRIMRVGLWFETKAEDGQLTPSQHAFLLDELSVGAPAACGVEDDLRALITLIMELEAARAGGIREPAVLHRQLLEYCGGVVKRWAEKGFRREVTAGGRNRRR